MRKLGILVIIATVFGIAGCKKEEQGLDVPATYSFNRDGSSTVSYSGQTQRLDMMQVLTNTMKAGNTVGTSVDGEELKNMFRNQNDPFAGATFSKNLISKCFASDTTVILSWMDQLATASNAGGTASSGTAGVLVDGSSDPNSGYLVNENGVELTQVIEKTVMGSVFFYQAMEVYFGEDRMGLLGNDDLADGENYTNMEHYFDEAFGYFGVPVDFPAASTLEDARFWGKYCKERNEDGINSGIADEIMLAFRTARTAISCKDYQTRDAQIAEISRLWGYVIASTAIDYLERAKSTTGVSVYKKHHYLSEAIGFMQAMKYHFNGGNSVVSPQYSYIVLEDAYDFVGVDADLYSVSDADIDNAIATIYQAFPQNTF